MEVSDAISAIRDPELSVGNRVAILMQQRSVGAVLTTDQVCNLLEQDQRRMAEIRHAVYASLNKYFKLGHLSKDEDKWAAKASMASFKIALRRKPSKVKPEKAPEHKKTGPIRTPEEICDMVVGLILELKARAEQPLAQCSRRQLIEELQRREVE